MHAHLLIANRTLGGPELRRVIEERVSVGDARFHVLVPATHGAGVMERIVDAYAGEPDRDDLLADLASARRRLEEELSWLRSLGVVAEGEIGSSDPVAAACGALVVSDYDEIILSTLPAGGSRWLGMDLPHRLERALGRPVTHVAGPAAE